MILVDANVWIDVFEPGSAWCDWSMNALAAAADRDQLAINPIIYAETAAGYATADALSARFEPEIVRRLPLPYAAGFAAGKAFQLYRRRGGARTAPLPDFYIGAHAAVQGLPILTRDPRRYQGYFPSVRLITPETET